MAYGNKFVKPVNKPESRSRHRVITETPDGIEYEFDPMMDAKKMTSWEVDASIKYFLDLVPRGPARPLGNKFVHFQRR
jgi:hypothetical protein